MSSSFSSNGRRDGKSHLVASSSDEGIQNVSVMVNVKLLPIVEPCVQKFNGKSECFLPDCIRKLNVLFLYGFTSFGVLIVKVQSFD